MIDEVLKQVDMVFPPKPFVKFDLEQTTELTVFDNKIGGIPYFPKDKEYPTDTVTGKPLVLFAQLNFGTFEPPVGFPKSGILQFFMANDEMYGLDFDEMTNQSSFRIVYHPEVIEDTSKLIDHVDLDITENMLPHNMPCKLIPNKASVMYVTPSCEDFDEVFVDAYNELNPDDQIDSMYDLDDVVQNKIYDRNGKLFVWIGGYPVYAQFEPRDEDKMKKYDTLLFESDSYFGKPLEIMWGDSGTGTLFISAEDLANNNFSDVMYSWDCC